MDTIYENESTPKKDGYRMPGEFEPQECIWMLWPHRPDNWRDGAKPAQKAYADVARGIAQYEPVIVGVNPEDYAAAHYVLTGEENILVVEMTSDDSWIRDCGPTFVVNDDGDVRAVHWHFNAWGGLYDGLYFPWDQDALVGVKVADLARAVRYRPDTFVLEGGSIHVDGEGTVMTTEMCLLSPGEDAAFRSATVPHARGGDARSTSINAWGGTLRPKQDAPRSRRLDRVEWRLHPREGTARPFEWTAKAP